MIYLVEEHVAVLSASVCAEATQRSWAQELEPRSPSSDFQMKCSPLFNLLDVVHVVHTIGPSIALMGRVIGFQYRNSYSVHFVLKEYL